MSKRQRLVRFLLLVLVSIVSMCIGVHLGQGAEAVPWLIGKLVELLMEVTCDDRKEREDRF